MCIRDRFNGERKQRKIKGIFFTESLRAIQEKVDLFFPNEEIIGVWIENIIELRVTRCNFTVHNTELTV